MAVYVVDASVVIQYLIVQSYTPEARVLVSHLLPRALQVGLVHQLAVYDSLYIALALSLNCPLITVDDRQSKGAIALCVNLKPITDFSPKE